MRTEQEKLRFIELRANNISFDKISKELNINKLTLIDWQVKHKNEIEKLKYIQFENLLEKHKQTTEKQFELYCNLIDKINSEIDKRDLKNINTKDLILIKEKLQEKINLIVEGVSCSVKLGIDLGLTDIEYNYEKLKLN